MIHHEQYQQIKQQHKYHNIFENIPIGILYFDIKGIITDVNNQATKIFGRTEEEFLGLNLLEKLVDEKLKDAIRKVITLGDGEYEGYYHPINGYKPSYLHITLKALYNEAGIITAAVALVEDISAEKEAQKTLAHYMHIVDATKDMIAYIDKDFRYLAVNKSYLNFHQKKMQEIIHHKVSDIVGEHNFNIIEPLLQRALEGEQFSIKSKYQYPSSEEVIYDEIYEEGHFSPYIDDTGEITGVVVSIRDITEEEMNKQKAHRFAKQTKHYLDIVPVMILALDHGANIIRINQKGCQILGYTQEELIGKNWIDTCIPMPLRDEIHLVFSQVIKSHAEYPLYHENSVLTKDGKERLIAWRNVTIEDDDGNIIEILSSGEDITDGRSDKI